MRVPCAAPAQVCGGAAWLPPTPLQAAAAAARRCRPAAASVLFVLPCAAVRPAVPLRCSLQPRRMMPASAAATHDAPRRSHAGAAAAGAGTGARRRAAQRGRTAAEVAPAAVVCVPATAAAALGLSPVVDSLHRQPVRARQRLQLHQRRRRWHRLDPERGRIARRLQRHHCALHSGLRAEALGALQTAAAPCTCTQRRSRACLSPQVRFGNVTCVSASPCTLAARLRSVSDANVPGGALSAAVPLQGAAALFEPPIRVAPGAKVAVVLEVAAGEARWPAALEWAGDTGEWRSLALTFSQGQGEHVQGGGAAGKAAPVSEHGGLQRSRPRREPLTHAAAPQASPGPCPMRGLTRCWAWRASCERLGCGWCLVAWAARALARARLAAAARQCCPPAGPARMWPAAPPPPAVTSGCGLR